MTTPQATPAPAHGHEHSDHDKRPYLRIFWMLLALTVVEVSTIFLPNGTVPHWMLGTFLMALAVAKAALVALYYMHLRYDPRLLAGIFLGPFGLALFFAAMMVLQSFF